MDGIIPREWLDAVEWTDINELPPDRFWRGNWDAYRKRPTPYWRMICKKAFKREAYRGDLHTKEMILYDCPSAIKELLEMMQCVVWKRRLILLDRLSSLLSLVPPGAKKGALICILYGCSVPVLLRKLSMRSRLKAPTRGWMKTEARCITSSSASALSI
jgi:hypothetical protein